MRITGPVALLAALALTVAACSSDTTPMAAEAPPLPGGLEGPISGGAYGIPYLAMPEGWEEDYGYREDEYFLSRQATSYGADGDLAVDGRWETFEEDPDTPGAFTTRLLVRQPEDPGDFNGTVVVEWLNVTAGRDSDPDFGFLADELLPNGYAYVAVSAQYTGVEPGGLGIEIPNVDPAALAPLKDWDPERYGELSHPGDDYSYDIFTQAAQVAAEPGGPLGELDIDHTIAVGESQSASRLVTYVNGVHQHTDAFDGYLIHSRGDGAAPLNDAGDQSPPSGVIVRDDLDAPVVIFETETDLGFLQYAKARQDDSDGIVTWEVAGTGHADRSTLDYGVKAGQRWTDATVDLSTSCGQVNEGPQQPVVQTAFAALVSWVIDGERPPAGPRIDLDAAGEVVRDADGIAVGGIRTPPVDAPIAVHTGENPSDDIICVLFGSTTPFTDEQLNERYADNADYVGQVTASADQAVADGYLLERHAQAMIAEAEAADVP